MAVKRIFNINDKKARICLKCGQKIPKEVLTQISDNKTGVCPNCGQAHFVDINGSRCTLTVVERKELRHRQEPANISLNSQDQDKKRIIELEAALEAEKENAKKWEEAAEGLARMVEEAAAVKQVDFNTWHKAMKDKVTKDAEC